MIKTIATYNLHNYLMVWRITKRMVCGRPLSYECTNKSILHSEHPSLHKDYACRCHMVDTDKVQEMTIDLMPVEYFIGDKNAHSVL